MYDMWGWYVGEEKPPKKPPLVEIREVLERCRRRDIYMPVYMPLFTPDDEKWLNRLGITSKKEKNDAEGTHD